MSFRKVKIAFKKFIGGGDEKKEGVQTLHYVVLYFMLSSFFAVHLYFVISEYLTKMFVDITSYKKLEDYAPDVAICFNRPYVAHKMDLQTNYYAYYSRKMRRCKFLPSNIDKLSVTAVSRYFRHFTRDQNILSEELKALESFHDIVARCQSHGHKCGAEDFEIFPRYIRHYKICIIFKAKAFFRKIAGFEKGDRPTSSNTYLSLFLHHNWLKHPRTWKSNPSLYSREYLGLKVFLLDRGSPLISPSRRVTETKLIKYVTASPGKWTEITFTIAVRNRSVTECSPYAKGFEILDEVDNKTYEFPYTPELCRAIGRQKTVKKKCGCYHIKHPLTPTDKNVTYCQTLPAIIRQAKSLSFDCKNQTIFLLDAANEVLDEESADTKSFKDIRCAKKYRKLVLADVKCPRACHKTVGEVVESSVADLETESVEEEFFNDTEKGDLQDGELPKYAVIKIQPTSWQIPVTKMEEVYPLSKLLSDLGGILGMWLGASIVGLIELILKLREKVIKKAKITPESVPENEDSQDRKEAL